MSSDEPGWKQCPGCASGDHIDLVEAPGRCGCPFCYCDEPRPLVAAVSAVPEEPTKVFDTTQDEG